MNLRHQLAVPEIDDIQETLSDFSAFRPVVQPSPQLTIPDQTAKIVQGFRGPKNGQSNPQRFFDTSDL